MTMTQFQTRVRAVFAIKYDGTNLDEVRAAVEAHLGENAPTLGNMLTKDSWIVVDDREPRRWRVMGQRQFEQDVEAPEKPRNCFNCVFLLLRSDSSSWCETFSEQILSESAAAKDCEAYLTAEDAK